MSDEIDKANDIEELMLNKDIDRIRKAASGMPKGYSGICYQCGEHSKRLVKGECCECRDLIDKRPY